MSDSDRQQRMWVRTVENFVNAVKTRKRFRIVTVAWFSLVLIFTATFSFPASADTVADERQFVQLINDLRTSKGLQPLLVDNELRVGSRGWSQQMATKDNLEHAEDLSSGISSNWTVLGENVGVTSGSDVQVLFDKFVASPDHFRNLVDPEFSHVGAGVVYDAQGKLWTTHRFMAVSGFNPSPVTSPPTTAAPRPTPTVPQQSPEPQQWSVPQQSPEPQQSSVPQQSPEPQPTPAVQPPSTNPPNNEQPETAPVLSRTLDEGLLVDVLKELATA